MFQLPVALLSTTPLFNAHMDNSNSLTLLLRYKILNGKTDPEVSSPPLAKQRRNKHANLI